MKIDNSDSKPNSKPTKSLIDILKNRTIWQLDRKKIWNGVLILFIGLLFTFIISFVLKNDAENNYKEKFIYDCDEITNKISARLNAHAQLLRSSSALFDININLNREQWQNAYLRQKLDRSLPGILGVGYSKVIKPSELKQHINQIRSEGFPNYDIYPDGKRDLYTSIIYLEPFEGRNLKAFGYDMYSEPIRKIAMQNSMDYNIASLSGKITLVQEIDNDIQAGTLMYVPVYKKGFPIENKEQRRIAIQGWVYSPYRMDDLMLGILGVDKNSENNSIQLQIFDDSNFSKKSILFDSKRLKNTHSNSAHQLFVKRIIQFNNHTWYLKYFDENDFISNIDYSKAWYTLFGGTSISILIFLIYLSLLTTNIKAEKIAEELTRDLRDSEEKYSKIFKNQIYAIAIFDLETVKIIDVNDRFCSLYGYTRDEILKGLSVPDFKFEGQLSETFLRDSESEDNVRFPLCFHKKKNGTVFPVEVVSGFYKWKDKKAMFALISDISERVRSEEILKEDLTTFRNMFQNHSSVMLSVEPKSKRIIAANYAAAEFYGYSIEQLQQMLVSQINQYDEEQINYEMQLAVNEERNYFIFPHKLANGEIRIVEVHSSPIEMNNQKLLFSIIHDITERIKIEKDFFENRNILANVIDSANIGTWQWNIKTGEVKFNERWAEIIGYKLSELQPISIDCWTKHSHPEDLRTSESILEQHFNGELDYYECEIRMKHKNGEWVWVLDKGKVNEWDENGKPILMFGTHFDITERKRREKFENELLELTVQLSAISSSEIPNILDQALRKSSSFLAADRVYIFEFDSNFETMSNTYEWCNDGISPEIDNLQNIPKEILPMWMEKLEKFENIIIPSVKNLPESWIAEREILEPQGIQSLIVIPIMNENRLNGFVGLDSVLRERNYSISEVKILQVWSNILGSMLNKKKMDESLEQTKDNYQTFFNSIDDFLFVLDEQGNIIHTNSTVNKRLGYNYEELIGKSVLVVHPEERREEAGRIVGEMLVGKAEFCPVPLITKNGSKIAVETRVTKGIWNGKNVIFGVTKDISQLKFSEEKFSKVFYLNPSACGFNDLENHYYTEVNEAFTSLLGYTNDEVIGKTAIELGIISPEMVQSVSSNADESGRIKDAEAVLKAKNGDLKNVLMSAENIIVQDKVYRFTVVQDITERKKAEEDLSNKQTLLRTIIDLIPDAIYVKDKDGRKVLANKKEVLLAGRNSEDEIIGKTDFELYPNHTDNKFIEEDNAVLHSGKALIDIEGIIKTKDEKIHSLLGSKVPLLDTQGNIIGIVGVNHDITERKQFEEKLKASDLLLNKLSRQVPGMIYQYQFYPDGNNYFPFASEHIWDIYETTPEEVKTDATKVLSRIHRSDYNRVVNNILKSFDTLETWEDEYRVVLPIKGERWLKGSANPEKLDDGSVLWHGSITDITKEKMAEIELAKIKDQFMLAINGTNDGIWDWDLVSGDLFLSKRWKQILGYEDDEIKNEYDSFASLLYEEDVEHVNDYVAKYLKGEIEKYNIEFRMKHKNGKLRWILAKGEAVRNENGIPYRMAGSHSDITDKKEAEVELRENKYQLELAMDAGEHAYWDWNLVSNKTYYSPKYYTMLGYDNEELPMNYETFNYLIHPDDKKEVLPIIEKSINTIQPYEVEFRLLCKNGSYKWIIGKGKSYLDEQTGKPYRSVGIHIDINERKLAEEEVRNREKQFRLLFEESPLGVYISTKDGNILDANKKLLEFLGSPSLEATKAINVQKFTPLIENGYAKIFKECVEAKIAKQLSLEYKSKWGISRYYSSYIIPLLGEDGEVQTLYTLMEDITERKNSEAELQQLSDDLRKNNSYLEEATIIANQLAKDAELANKSKSMFLANMSHEIRTPLNAIIGFSQLMSRDKLLSESQKEYNESILKAGEHLLMLINDILELSKVEAGKIVFSPSNVDLESFWIDIQMIFKERAQSKHLQLIFEISDKIPKYGFIDEGKLRQIFVNIIGNAIKFTEKGTITVKANIQEIDNERTNLVVEIEDTGPGIAENEIENLFKHFVQTSTGIKKGSGTGLGLALSRELAILMGGNISVKSTFGKGSTFTFNVELKQGEISNVEANKFKRIISIENSEKKYRILVADDKIENLKVAVAMLKMVGFETMEATDGEDAISKFEQWNPDLILMDIRMPKMDGIEATKRIKSTTKGAKIPIVPITANTFEEDLEKTNSAGMIGYIHKPFRENELFQTIGNILGINYIYDDSEPIITHDNFGDEALINNEMSKLPKQMIEKMLNALKVADLDLLLELIKSFEIEFPELAKYLIKLTNNFDYNKLQQIFNETEQVDE